MREVGMDGNQPLSHINDADYRQPSADRSLGAEFLEALLDGLSGGLL
jgi:hypothetical protein